MLLTLHVSRPIIIHHSLGFLVVDGNIQFIIDSVVYLAIYSQSGSLIFQLSSFDDAIVNYCDELNAIEILGNDYSINNYNYRTDYRV